MLKSFLGIVFSFSSSVALSATVAVIDSGVDVDHANLKASVWQNPIDHSFDLFDDDGNGRTDDVYGWNFLENNNVLIDLTQSSLLTPDVKTFFDLQSKVLTGQATEAQKSWLRKKIADSSFRSRITQYGAFAHGTHVAGIAAGEYAENKVLTIRLIPTKNPLQGLIGKVGKANQEGKDPNWIVKNIIKGGLFVFAKLQGQVFAPIGQYLAEKEVDVANGSFGLGVPQARMLVYPILRLVEGNKEPRGELVDELAIFLTNQVAKSQASLVKNSPETLFVFAAGNDALNTDEYPVAPATIKLPNSMSVAATTAAGELAVFSNYGTTVDVAAPGVAIESLTPHGPKISMSGTSQAAPKVAGLAAALKAMNPGLTPAEIKEIIMGTADKKEALKEKVASGLMNSKRAMLAATLSREQAVGTAIAEARSTVQDGFVPYMSTSMSAEWFIDLMPSLLVEDTATP